MASVAAAAALLLLATDLRVDFLAQPLALGHAQPEFQWIPALADAGTSRGASLASAQLQVSLDPTFLAPPLCNLTTAGPGNTASCPGNFSQVDTLLHWRVRLLAVGAPMYGAWATSWFGTGFPGGRGDVQGVWVAATGGLPSSVVRTRALRCRAVIPRSALPADVASARLHIASPAYYTASSAGTRLDGKSETGPWTQFLHRVMLDTWDVLAAVGSGGPLVLGLRVGGGPFASLKFVDWAGSAGLPLLVQLTLVDSAGRGVTFATGGGLNLSCAPDSITYTEWYDVETSDGRVEAAYAGWDTPTYTPGADWVPALPASSTPGDPTYVSVCGAELSSRDFQHVDTFPALLPPPTSLSRASDGSWVYDLGQNSACRVALAVPRTLPPGTVLTLIAGELLHPENGTVYNQLSYGTNMSVVHTVGGYEGEVVSNTFTFWGAQYVGVYGVPEGVSLQLGDVVTEPLSITVPPAAGITFGGVAPSASIARAYASGGAPAPAPATPWSAVSSPLDVSILAGVQHSLVWSARSNWQGLPSDCPNREKRGWMGDGSVAGRAVSWNVAPVAGYRAWLRSVQDNQVLNAQKFPADAGTVAVFVPSAPTSGGDAAWSSVMAETVTNLWRHSGDTASVGAFYPLIREYVLTFLAKHINATLGLMVDQALYGDWDAQFPRTLYSPNTKVLCATSSHMRMAQQLLPMAEALGRTDDVQALQQLLNASVSRYTAYFAAVNTSTGVLMYGDGIEQTNAVLPLSLNFVPPVAKAGVVAWLINDIESTWGMHLSTGALGTRHVLYVLSAEGRTDLAGALAAQSSLPSWGFWTTQGGTTLWENWSGVADDPHPPPPTHNHIFLGSHGGWLYEHLLGLDQATGTVGWAQPVVTPPALSSLPSMAGWLASVAGPVNVSWAWGDAASPVGPGVSFALNVTFPPSVTARVRLPVPALSNPVVTEGGRVVVWSDGAFHPGACPGVTAGSLVQVGPPGHTVAYVELEVGQGAYALLASQGAQATPAAEVRVCVPLSALAGGAAAAGSSAAAGSPAAACPAGSTASRVAWAGFVSGAEEAGRALAGHTDVRLHKRHLVTHAVEARTAGARSWAGLEGETPGVGLLDTPGTHLCAALVCTHGA